jgi:hypothetical protein
MKTVPTDTAGVALTLGEHLGSDPAEHVSFGRNTLENSSYAYVDSLNRRVIYFLTAPSVDHRCCGGKVKRAEQAYEAKYGSLGIPCVVQVRDGIVTSLQAATQKHTYHWDWATHGQVVDRDRTGGWKYDEAGASK